MDLSATLVGEVVSAAPHLTMFRSLFSAGGMPLSRRGGGADAGALRRGRSGDRRGSGPIRCASRTAPASPCRSKIRRSTRSTSASRRRAGRAARRASRCRCFATGRAANISRISTPSPASPTSASLTMIVWLSEDYEGGETLFMKTGAKLKGRTGDALLFRNARPDGTPRSRLRPCRPAGDSRREADRQPLDPRAAVRAGRPPRTLKRGQSPIFPY